MNKIINKINTISNNNEKYNTKISHNSFMQLLDYTLSNYDCLIYSNQRYLSYYNLTLKIPIYNTETNELSNFEPDILKDNINTIIHIPILIYNNNKTFHMSSFNINLDYKYCIYFDSYGHSTNCLIDKNDSNNIISSIKYELVLHDIIDDSYKTIINNEPFQTNVSTNKHDWFYIYTCPLVQVLFMMFMNTHSNLKYAKMLKMMIILNNYSKKSDFKTLIGQLASIIN